MDLNIDKFRKQSVKVILNCLLYNIGWFVTIIGASRGDGIVGPIFGIFVVAVHLVSRGKFWSNEIIFILAATAIGSFVDSIPSSIGFVTFSAASPCFFAKYPIWMSFLWAEFATTFSYCLRWMRERYFLGLIFGGIGGPASLYAGVELGAATLNSDSGVVMLISSVEWMILIPIILFLHRKIIP